MTRDALNNGGVEEKLRCVMKCALSNSHELLLNR